MKYWLRKRVLTLKLEETTAKLNWYEEQFRLLQQQRFGAKSEKVSPEQLSLFNDAEGSSDETKQEHTFDEITYKRRKGKRTKEELIRELPVETI